MRYTIILVPGNGSTVSVMVPAMPGCFSMGRTRDEALTNARDAMAGWLEEEAAQGRGPLPETPAVVVDGVARAIEIINDMRLAGELPAEHGYDFELASVEIPQSLAA